MPWLHRRDMVCEPARRVLLPSLVVVGGGGRSRIGEVAGTVRGAEQAAAAGSQMSSAVGARAIVCERRGCSRGAEVRGVLGYS